MATNQPRGTPGLILLAFAVIVLGIALVGWIQHWQR
jgi:hypothetical protein